MNSAGREEIRIQILEAKKEARAVARAVGVVRDRVQDVAVFGRERGAEALLVCPAPEELVEDGIEVVVAARFGDEIVDDDLFWRQHSLADEFHHALKVEALVLDLDKPLDEFLKHIAPLLAAPYRDEIGRRDWHWRPSGDGNGARVPRNPAPRLS
jgi:hypothetical protein